MTAEIFFKKRGTHERVGIIFVYCKSNCKRISKNKQISATTYKRLTYLRPKFERWKVAKEMQFLTAQNDLLGGRGWWLVPRETLRNERGLGSGPLLF